MDTIADITQIRWWITDESEGDVGSRLSYQILCVIHFQIQKSRRYAREPPVHRSVNWKTWPKSVPSDYAIDQRVMITSLPCKWHWTPRKKDARRKISHAQFFECVLPFFAGGWCQFWGSYVVIRLHQPQWLLVGITLAISLKSGTITTSKLKLKSQWIMKVNGHGPW